MDIGGKFGGSEFLVGVEFLEGFEDRGEATGDRAGSGDHFVEDLAEGVDVGRGGGVCGGVVLFGGHVVGGADAEGGGGVGALKVKGDPEVEDFDLPSRRAVRWGDEEDIFGFEVAMDHSGLVGDGEGICDLLDKAEGVSERKAFVGLKELPEVLTFEPFH